MGSGLQLWLKADQGIEEAVSDPAEPGDNISDWLDQSGNANDFTNDFGSAPVFRRRDGRYSADFSDGSAYLRAASFLSGTGARTMIVVGQPTTLVGGSANNCIFQLAPNEASGMGYSLFLEEPDASTGLACRVSGNRVMNYATNSTKPTMFSIQNNASENVGQTVFYANGDQITDELSSNPSILNTSSLGCAMGGFSNNADNNPENQFDFNGDVSEIIVYNQSLSNADRQAIETYLNIRYGINIPVASHNYYSHTAYPEDIAGLGQEIFNEGYSQDSSFSVNNSSILSIYNPADMIDGEYLVWGHDGGSVFPVNTGIPASVNNRLDRIWRVEETGDVGSVTIKMNLANLVRCGGSLVAGDFELLIDGADTDFSDATTITASGLSGTEVVFTGVDLNDGDYFTVGYNGSSITPPGNVGSDLVLWLRSDCGCEEAVNDDAEVGDNVQYWRDISGSGNDLEQVYGSAPTYQNIGGNNVVDFSGGSHYLHGDAPLSGPTGRTMIVVAQPTALNNSVSNCAFALAPNDNGGSGYGLFLEQPGGSNGLAIRVSGNKVMNHTVSTTDLNIIQTSGGSGINVTETDFYVNGEYVVDIQSQSANALNTNSLGTIMGGFGAGGSVVPNTAYDYNGYISEVIVYDRELSCDEREAIELYLKDKYGISLYYEETEDIADNGIATIDPDSVYTTTTTATSSAVTISDVSAINDCIDTIYFAHDGALGLTDKPSDPDMIGLTGTNVWRWTRQWYGIVVSNDGDPGNVTLVFDFDDYPSAAGTTPAGSDYMVITSASPWIETPLVSGPTINGAQNTVSFVVDADEIHKKYFTLATRDQTASPLPVELTTFTAKTLTDKVQLNWATATEVNNDYFEVQRSGNGQDFEHLKTVNGVGNSNTTNHYETFDKDPLKGLSYYRLKQVDFDGSFTYSDIVTAEFNGQGISIYPNPGSDLFFLEGSDMEQIRNIALLDIAGRTIEHALPINSKGNRTAINLEQYPSGIYFVQLQMISGDANLIKVVIEK